MLAGLLLAVMLAGCGGLPDGDAAARVDGTVVSRTLLETQVRALEAGSDAPEAMDPERREVLIGSRQREVLALLIQVAVIENLVAQYDIEVPQAEIEARAAEEVEAFGGEEALADVLLAQSITPRLYLDVLLPTQLAIDALAARLAEDAPPLETRTVRHVLVDTEQEALEVLAALRAGEDFAAVAEARSTDVGSAMVGGDLGPAPQGAYVPEFDDAAWGAALDEVVGPISTDFGFHVLQVTAIDTTSIAELEEFQIEQVVGPQLTELINDAFGSAEVVVAPGLGRWDPSTGAVDPLPTVARGTPAPPLGGAGQAEG